MIWRFRLAARTHASHAWNTSSILVGATTAERRPLGLRFFCVYSLKYREKCIKRLAFNKYCPFFAKKYRKDVDCLKIKHYICEQIRNSQ